MKFVIFSCGYNAAKYVSGHMKSIQGQLYKNYIHIIVDDFSQDRTPEEIEKYRDERTVVYRNIENKKWIRNALQYLDKHITSDEDIIVLVDLDDTLSHNTVLNKLVKTYEKKDCWMSYSLFRYNNGRSSSWIPRYDPIIMEKKLYRSTIWSFTHLRTFKAFLWNKLDKEDLKDKDGNYFPCTYDQAVLLPCLEMCPPNKIVFIDDIMYNYNDGNPLQVEKINRKQQEEIARYIRGKKKYETITR